MKKGTKISLIAVVCFAVGTPVIAQQSHFYFPAEDQSPEQQAKDVAECKTWAITQTGFNPAYPPPPPTGYVPPPVDYGPDGSALRGAARGAAAGALGGQIFGKKPGKGAAIGAATGALLGGMRRNQRRRDQQAAQQQALDQQEYQFALYQQQLEQLHAQHNNAVAVCMAGNGYTVN